MQTKHTNNDFPLVLMQLSAKFVEWHGICFDKHVTDNCLCLSPLKVNPSNPEGAVKLVFYVNPKRLGS